MLPNLLNAFSYFLFPKRCIHCKLLLAIDNKAYFCDCCSELLTPLTEKNRCHYCFQEEGLIGKNICYRCCTKKEMLCKKAAVFEYLGPASSLLKSFKYGEEPYLAKGIGGFMAAQLLQLGWKIPDIIIPIPTSFSHKLSRGFDHTFLIAKTMGKILSCPVKNAMWRDSLDYSQAGLSRSQRKNVSNSRKSKISPTNISFLSMMSPHLVQHSITAAQSSKKSAPPLFKL